MNFKSLDDLLHLDVSCAMVMTGDAALLIIGDRTQSLAAQLRASGANVQDHRARLLFGLSILTAPFPLFVGGVMTERNTSLAHMSVFGWIEDNYIEQPRAEVFGLTPFGEQPVLFLRDFDMDRPVEVWFQTALPSRWVRVVGIVVASSRASADLQLLKGDDAALIAMQAALPADVQPVLEAMRIEVSGGERLKPLLRKLRKSADERLMHTLDGWRVLAQATQIAQLNPSPAPSPNQDANVVDALKLAPSKRW